MGEVELSRMVLHFCFHVLLSPRHFLLDWHWHWPFLYNTSRETAITSGDRPSSLLLPSRNRMHMDAR